VGEYAGEVGLYAGEVGLQTNASEIKEGIQDTVTKAFNRQGNGVLCLGKPVGRAGG
jgi:hypothetical protein